MLRLVRLCVLALVASGMSGHLAAQVEIFEAGAGLARSFDGRTKTKNFGGVSLVLAVDGAFPDGDVELVCTGRVFDGKTADGLGKRRKGVKVFFSGEVLDAATGARIQKIKKKKKKTDSEGDFEIDLSLGNHADAFIFLDGRFKKKKTTGAFLNCNARAAGAEQQLLGIASESVLERPSQGPDITSQTVNVRSEGLFSPGSGIGAFARIDLQQKRIEGTSTADTCVVFVRVTDFLNRAKTIPDAEVEISFGLIDEGFNLKESPTEVVAKTDADGFAEVKLPKKVKEGLQDTSRRFLDIGVKVEVPDSETSETMYVEFSAFVTTRQGP